MGADYIQVVLEVPTEKQMVMWEEATSTLTDQDIIRLADDFGCPLLPYCDDETEIAEARSTITEIGEYVHTIFRGIGDKRWTAIPRDCGTFLTRANELHLITGGLSWGDSPTESYDYLLAWEIINTYATERWTKAS